jgi:hypothetical protein
MREQSEQRRSQLGNIAAGYLAAVVVADVIFFALFWLAWPAPRHNDMLGMAMVGAVVAMPLIIVITLPLAVAIIWQSERHQVHSWVFYATAGALVNVMVVGAFIAFLMWRDYEQGRAFRWPAFPLAEYIQMFLPGLCAGLVYWRVAGRNAGRNARAT